MVACFPWILILVGVGKVSFIIEFICLHQLTRRQRHYVFVHPAAALVSLFVHLYGQIFLQWWLMNSFNVHWPLLMIWLDSGGQRSRSQQAVEVVKASTSIPGVSKSHLLVCRALWCAGAAENGQHKNGQNHDDSPAVVVLFAASCMLFILFFSVCTCLPKPAV